MTTEAEAKETWCPFARVLLDEGVSGNRIDSTDPGIRTTIPKYGACCIGSACMAWRWESAEAFERRQEAYDDSLNIAGINTREEPVPKGFCGLAGTPA